MQERIKESERKANVGNNNKFSDVEEIQRAVEAEVIGKFSNYD